MIRKKKLILEIYKDKKATYLEPTTILKALEKRGFKWTRRGLSNFIRHSLQPRHLVPDRDSTGTIVGWTLINPG